MIRYRSCSVLPLFLLAVGSSIHAQSLRLGQNPLSPQLVTSSASVSATPFHNHFRVGSQCAGRGLSGDHYFDSLAFGPERHCSPLRFFNSTSALTEPSGAFIPSSVVLGRCPTGSPTSNRPFTQTSALGAGSSLLIFQQNRSVEPAWQSHRPALSHNRPFFTPTTIRWHIHRYSDPTSPSALIRLAGTGTRGMSLERRLDLMEKYWP